MPKKKSQDSYQLWKYTIGRSNSLRSYMEKGTNHRQCIKIAVNTHSRVFLRGCMEGSYVRNHSLF
jgi:hypothetical protein